MKRLLSIMLALLMVVTALPMTGVVAFAETVDDAIGTIGTIFDSGKTDVETMDKQASLITSTDGGITRAEWLYNLVVVFNMAVGEESYPDNYFIDLDSSHTYYEDILMAVEFGVVDIEAGGELRPDDIATREFVTSTLNFCLGYQMDADAEYTFADYADCTYPESAQIALNRNWVSLIEGNFSPETNVTDAEVQAMINDATAVLEQSVQDPNHEDVVEFAEDVIEVPAGTVVTEDDETKVVSITDCPVTINVGDKFAVYYNEIPVVYTAESVTVDSNITNISTVAVESDEAFEEIDIQGTTDADVMEITPAEGVELTIEEDNSGISTFDIAKIKKTIGAKKTITLGNGVKATINAKLKNPYVEYDVSSNYSYVQLVGDAEITFSASVNLTDIAGISSITLFDASVPGVGGFTVTLNMELSGKASGTVTGKLVAGLECAKGSDIRAIKSFTQTQYYTTAEATAEVALKATLGVTKLPVVNAYLYATVGMVANVKSTYYSSDTPMNCTHFGAYLYANYGASASVKFLGWSKSFNENYDIFTASNSPVRIMHHYEDGAEVASCTRGQSYSNFFTQYNSRWGGCGWSSANGGYGLDAAGVPIVLYTYTLDDDNNATITKYNGNSWYVNIPSEIDGYTVTAIGNNAFRGKDVAYVTIPSTVTSIGNNAFQYCYNLRNITIPNSVTSIGGWAFSECISLTSIDLPNEIEKIEHATFYECVSLMSITIPDSVVEMGNSVFYGCVSLKNVTLSKSLVTLGSQAFSKTIIETINIPKSLDSCATGWSGASYKFENVTYDAFAIGPFARCEKLKAVTFEDGTTQIAQGLFSGCSGLEKISIPDTVTVIESCAFEDCLSLKEITIPDSVTEIQSNAFDRCVALPKVVIPDSVTNMGNSVLEGSTAIQDVKLSKNVNKIPQKTFRNCTSLKTIEIPANVENIYSYAFENCTSLESVTFAEKSKLETIYYSAFKGCSSLKEAIIPENTREIGAYAFQNCSELEKVYIPQSTKTIGNQAFMGCEALSDVTIADYSITSIGTDTFKDCPGLVSIVLPKGLTTIGSQAFMNCTGLTSVTIPESVTSIDSTAFSYPKKTTIYGKTGSYAETFANEYGFTFVDISIPAQGIILKDGSEIVNLDRGETYRAEFEFYPENANDVVTLTANNTNLKIEGMDIYAQSAGDTVITATTSSGMTYEFTVHIRDAKSIIITSNPDKMTYALGEEFDNTGMTVTVNYSDNTTEVVTDYTVSGFDSSAEGSCTVTVQWTSPAGSTYKKTFTVEIVDTSPKVTDIYVGTLPNKVEYALRESLDTTGLVIMANYTDGSTSAVTGYTVSGFNALKTGEQTITVTYGEFTTTFTVSVGTTAKTLESIAISTNPSKTTYYIGDSLDTTGLVLTLTYSDGSTTTATSGFTTSGFSSNAIGTKTITVTYSGKTTAFTVTVKRPTITLSSTSNTLDIGGSITLTATTTPTGQDVAWTTSNSNIATVENGVVTAVGAGTSTITATFTYNGANYSKTCSITVNELGECAHSNVTNVVAQPSTCLVHGNDAYTICNDCGVVISGSNAELPLVGHNYIYGTCESCGEKDPSFTDESEQNYTFSIQEPSRTEIRNKDGIILHANVEGNAPTGSYVVWTSSNGNFDEDVDGNSLTVIAESKGYTTFTATLYDAEGNVLTTDSVELYSKSGFFDKIGGFFRSLFGSTKIYDN